MGTEPYLGSIIDLMGVQSSSRVPCDDEKCPLQHFENRPELGRYHYEDDPRSAIPGVLCGYEYGRWPQQGKRPILSLANGSIVTCDLADAEVVNNIAQEEEARALLRKEALVYVDESNQVRVVPRISGGATAPSFAATVGTEAASVSTANTNRDGTGTIATILTAGSNGTKIEEIVLKAEDNPADSMVIFFLHDGSSYHMFDEWDVGDPADATTTVASYRENRTYENLVIPSSWSLRALTTVALTAGVFKVIALAGDF